jgi:hypothetical protein
MEYIMKKVLVAMIVVLAANGAHADTQTDHAIIGTLLGGFIGYQIAKATEPRTVPVPQGVPIYQDPRVASHTCHDAGTVLIVSTNTVSQFICRNATDFG